MDERPGSEDGAVSAQRTQESASPIFSRFMGGAVFMGTASVATTLLGLVTTIFVVRQLLPEEFGVLVLLQVASIFFSEVGSFGMNLAIPKFLASSEEIQYRSDLIRTALFFRVISVMLIGLGILMAGPLLVGPFGSPALLDLLPYLALWFGINSIGKLFASTLQGVFRFRTLASVNLASSVLNLLLVLVFVLWLKQGLVGVIQAQALAWITVYAVTFAALPHRRGGVFQTALLKKMLSFGLPLQLQYILDFAHSRMDTLLIGLFLGPTAVAFYAVAQRIPQSLSGLYEAFRVVYLPFVSNLHALNERQKVIDLLNHSVRWLSFLTMFGALFALVFGHEIIVLVFTEKYLPSLYAFVLLMIGLNLHCVESTLGYSLIGIGEPDKPLVVNLLRAVTSLVLNLLLIPVFGFVGAALTNVAGNAAAIPMDRMFLERRAIKVRIRGYIKPVLAFAVCGIVFISLGDSPIPIKLGIVALYGILCMFFAVITPRDLEAVSNEVRMTATGLFRRLRWKGTI